ncbi:MAG: hypothetical protein U0796_19590 [Gemmatales bacterium]
MTRENWLALFNKIPEKMHDLVVLSLSTGIDVYIQRFLQFGDDSILLRGRLGGTDEGERIFLVPWDELRIIFFNRPVEDEALYQTFGELIGGVKKSMATKSKQQEEEEEQEQEDEEGRPEPVRLPPASLQALTEAASPRPDVSSIRNRLLQPRKPPPNTQTNKPGPGSKPPGR